ncbi:PhzF family phenazine biosynthesis protein [Natrialbaceae archaeon A-gly3]
METIRVLQVDAFADEPLAGNPAGVVPNADGLTDEQMGAIAAEMAVSETAFLSSSDEADRRIRYFTPSQEVDLCGHATIAAYTHLHEEGLEAGTTTLETNAGIVAVEVEPDGTVWMEQDRPTVRESEVDYDRVTEALGVDRSALEAVGADLPLAVVSSGLSFLIVPVAYLSDLGGMDPDMAAIESLCVAVEATGIYAFTFDTLEADSTAHGRMFAPAVGVPEDPVTGTASGALGAYLERFGALERPGEETTETGGGAIGLEQGHYVDRPGYVRVQTAGTIRIGGRGVTALEGTLVVPETDEDDILEA